MVTPRLLYGGGAPLLLLLLLVVVSWSDAAKLRVQPSMFPSTILAGTFPRDFIFGVSTSSYQIEGGWLDGGKGLSIWDALSHIPGRIANGDTGDRATDHYHRYKEDIQLMAQYGIKHYRMSISWPRIIPTGVGDINPEGLAFYSDVIDTLLDHGITPYVTLYHSEMPLGLAMYPRNSNPLLSDDFPEIFANYTDVVFDRLGDRVKNWFTFNEPWCAAVLGVEGPYDPYLIGHTLLKAHALTVKLYRTKYQDIQQGRIGIVLNTGHYYPLDPNLEADVQAAQRSYDFNLGWFADPIFATGDYPQSMRDTCQDRLPRFTKEERADLLGSSDFLAINYYMSFLVSSGGNATSSLGAVSYPMDVNVVSSVDPSWQLTQTGWPIVPEGLQELLMYIKDKYDNIPVMITENGMAIKEDNVTQALNDTPRLEYIRNHIENIGLAIRRGSSVEGYFVWSLFDNLEWTSGYEIKFGMVRIEGANLTRVPKLSLRYYQELLAAYDQASRQSFLTKKSGGHLRG